MCPSDRMYSDFENYKNIKQKSMEVYRSQNISELTSQMEATVKGGSFINEKSLTNKELLDSRDVVKRKKDLRSGISFIFRGEKLLLLQTYRRQ